MAVITQKFESKIETESRQGLTAGEVVSWASGLPDRARIVAIQRDIGTQRDPWMVTAGLRATWDGE